MLPLSHWPFGWSNWCKNKVWFCALVNLLRVLFWKNIKYSPTICCISCCADNNTHKYKSRAVTLYLIKHRILIRGDFIDIMSLCMIDYLIGQWAHELFISFWRICHGVFVLQFVTRDSFGLTCTRSRLEHVIMWHFELSSFSIENRFLMTVHL